MIITSYEQLILLRASILLCACLCACAQLVFVSPEWADVVEPSLTVVIEDTGFECESPPCLLHLALNQEEIYSGPLQHHLISVMLSVAPGHHQLAVYASMQAAANGKVLCDTVLFIARDKQVEQERKHTFGSLVGQGPQRQAISHSPACPPYNRSSLPSSSARACQVLRRLGDCHALPGLCDHWHYDSPQLHRSVDARMGSLNTSDPDVWLRVDSCIYSVLIMTANAIAAPAPVLAPSAFDLALIAAASARACPGALRSGEWMRSLQRDVASYWDDPTQSGKSDSVFFIVVSGTSFMRNRARAVRCSWAARAQNVLLISGKHEVFVDRCSTLAGANYPHWHALHASHAVSSSSLKNLTARALSHDDFFSSVPKFMLSLLLAWQLNPSADWYYMAGCDTVVHPAALGALLSGMDASKRVLVGGHAGVTRLLRSQLFLSGGAGLALSRAAVVALMPVIEDFTEQWLLEEGAACRCIPCADVALQRLCERHGIEMIELDGFYAFPPSHYMGMNVLRPGFAEKFPWEQRLPQCHNALQQLVERQGFQDMLQSMDGRWGRSRSMAAPPVAFHYLAPRRMHQSWLLLQSLHALQSKGLC